MAAPLARTCPPPSTTRWPIFDRVGQSSPGSVWPGGRTGIGLSVKAERHGFALHRAVPRSSSPGRRRSPGSRSASTGRCDRRSRPAPLVDAADARLRPPLARLPLLDLLVGEGDHRHAPPVDRAASQRPRSFTGAGHINFPCGIDGIEPALGDEMAGRVPQRRGLRREGIEAVHPGIETGLLHVALRQQQVLLAAVDEEDLGSDRRPRASDRRWSGRWGAPGARSGRWAPSRRWPPRPPAPPGRRHGRCVPARRPAVARDRTIPAWP